jgi:hypothetical protein
VCKLCRLLGFGLLGVSGAGRVELLVEPGPWRPRRDAKRRSRLVDEHRRRLGDPVLGGTCKMPLMTAYRQQALACAASLRNGPRRISEIKIAIPDAPKILLRNVYGWFFRVERGVYGLTLEGRLRSPVGRRQRSRCSRRLRCRLLPVLGLGERWASSSLRTSRECWRFAAICHAFEEIAGAYPDQKQRRPAPRSRQPFSKLPLWSAKT